MTRRFQTALARAYTDSTARQELYRGETGGFASFELSPTELTSLAEFAQKNRVSLELYASILVKKKGTPLQKDLPVMYEVLQFAEGDGWKRMWSDFYEAMPPSEGETPASQAEAFASHVASRASSFGRHAQLVAEAAHYERVKASLMGPAAVARRQPDAAQSRARCPLVPGPFVVETFQYDLLAIKNRTPLAGAPPPITRTPILFCRHAESGGLIVARITSALAAIIAQCDGHTTIEEIAARVGANEGLSVTAIESAVSVLMARGVVAQTSWGVHEHV